MPYLVFTYTSASISCVPSLAYTESNGFLISGVIAVQNVTFLVTTENLYTLKH